MNRCTALQRKAGWRWNESAETKRHKQRVKMGTQWRPGGCEETERKRQKGGDRGLAAVSVYSGIDVISLLPCVPKQSVGYQVEIFSSLFLIIQVMFLSEVLYTRVHHMLTVQCLYIGRSYDRIHVCCPLGYNKLYPHAVCSSRPTRVFHSCVTYSPCNALRNKLYFWMYSIYSIYCF